MFGLINRIRAAHALSASFQNGKKPRTADLKAIGLSSEFAERFPHSSKLK